MSTSSLSKTGKITIPKEILVCLGWQPGERITFTCVDDGTVILRCKNKSVLDLAGMLHHAGRPPLPVEKLSF